MKCKDCGANCSGSSCPNCSKKSMGQMMGMKKGMEQMPKGKKQMPMGFKRGK
jgi:hypothetical protein